MEVFRLRVEEGGGRVRQFLQVNSGEGLIDLLDPVRQPDQGLLPVAEFAGQSLPENGSVVPLLGPERNSLLSSFGNLYSLRELGVVDLLRIKVYIFVAIDHDYLDRVFDGRCFRVHAKYGVVEGEFCALTEEREGRAWVVDETGVVWDSDRRDVTVDIELDEVDVDKSVSRDRDLIFYFFFC